MMGSMQARPRGRPPASSRDAIEETAIDLFLEHGYEQTTIGMITAACGIGRTTLFRYYRSKADIVWSAFSEHTEHLRKTLAASHPGSPTMTAVRVAVVEALAASMDSRGIWMKRFQILDTSTVLRAEESAHWISWADAIADFVAEDVGLEPAGVVPQAIGGAVQAAFLAVLRGWQGIPDPGGHILPRLDGDLRGLCDALQAWLADTGR
jgi:TetR/AcrR family transcriptional regulator, regulator of mycofactocin system